MADYHVFSSENMVDWTDHGVVLKKSQTRWVATSTSPTGPFKKPRILYVFGKYTYRGSIIKSSPPDFPMIKTAHGSTIEVNGQWYLAYHYEVDGYYRRTTCIDSLFYNQDGTFQLVIPTKRGISPVIY